MSNLLLCCLAVAIVDEPARTPAAVSECLERVREVHGEAGPWAVVGYRMGERALKELGLPRHSHRLMVTHRSPELVQFSCIADGVQAATGASPGKLNLRIEPTPVERLATIVEDRETGRRLVFVPRPDFARSIRDLPYDRLAERGREVAEMADDELFSVAVEAAAEPRPR